MYRVLILASLFVVLSPFAALAQELQVDPLVGLLTDFATNNGAATVWITVITIAVPLLRGLAATLAKHVPDSKYAWALPLVNWAAGNGKYAANGDGNTNANVTP